MKNTVPVRKIAILSPAHPLRGGIAAFTERLAKELQQHGYEVTIYSFCFQYPGFLFPGKTQYTNDPPPPGLDIRPVIHSLNPFNWWRVGRMIRKDRPDLALVRYWLPFMGPCLGSILRIIRSNRQTRTIAIADNIIPHEKRPGDYLLTRYFAGAVDAFIVMSISVKEDLRQLGINKPVAYIPHPVYDTYGAIVSREVALRHLGLSEDYSYLLFFGFIRDYKGLDLLLQAMADPRLRRMGIRLIVAGEFYSDEGSYRELIRNLDLTDQVILFSEFIPNEEVKYYFGAADLVVQPYKSATQSGISQMAYHFEKPMIVTRVGGLPEIVEHGKAGYVVERNPAAIANAIADFFENDRKPMMTEGVRENKKRFSWKSMVEGIVNSGDGVLNN